MLVVADLIPDQLEELAQRRIGPAPVVVWIGGAAVIVAVGAAILRRRRTGSATIPDAPTAAVGDDAPTSTSTAKASPFAGGFVATGGSATGTSSGTGIADPLAFTAPTVTTNADWRRRAETWAIGHGYPALVSSQAFARFLSSEPLTAQEFAIVDAALTAVGPTPEPVAPPLIIPTPTDSGGGGNDGMPAGEVGDNGGGATWVQVSLDVIGADWDAIAAQHQPGMSGAQFLAALKAAGYHGWQSSNGGPISISQQPPSSSPE